ncbi:MAG: ABC transporter permease [Clostridiales bacterium]|nr:ABC transporter permease [Clostridiales bacterium]
MKRNRIGYFIKEGVSSIFTHGFMSFASIFIIMACLIIMGSFSLLAVNMEYIIRNMEKQNQVVAFVDESLTPEQAQALESDIKAVPNVASVRYVTREEAYESFLDQYKDIKLFEDVGSSILRDRYVMTLHDIEQMAQTRDDLRAIYGIAGVNAHLEIAKGFVTVRNIVGAVSISLVVILLIVSVFIMSNTVKLTTFNRREEIAIMKMVGATNSFIRWPFVFEGMMLGVLGSLLAYLLQWGLYSFAVDRMSRSVALSFITFLKYEVIAIPMLIVFAGIGLLVGIGGSLFAIKNYLKV